MVIPKHLRDQASLQPGDEVEFRSDGETIVMSACRQPAGLGGRFTLSGMARRLLDDRASEPR